MWIPLLAGGLLGTQHPSDDKLVPSTLSCLPSPYFPHISLIRIVKFHVLIYLLFFFNNYCVK